MSEKPTMPPMWASAGGEREQHTSAKRAGRTDDGKRTSEETNWR
jgi:hypothetical protein